MAKKVTLKTIADKVGVSAAAVSMVLSEKHLNRFTAERIKQINDAAREAGYEAKIKSKNFLNVVIIICPALVNPYYSTLIQGMERAAYQLNLRTSIFTTYWDKAQEESILKYAKKNNVLGIIYAMIPQLPEEASLLSKTIPVVAVGDLNTSMNFDTVDINNFSAGRMIARHVIELGHKNIAYITTGLDSFHSSRVQRYKGLQVECEKAGLLNMPVLFCKSLSTKEELNRITAEHDTGYELTKRCMEKMPEATALIGINDMVAYGIIDAVLDSGKRIPEDFSVCGFDNIFPSAQRNVSLTTVEHFIFEKGSRAVSLINSKFKAKPDFNTENAVIRVEFTPKLVIRSSTAGAR